MLKMLFLLGFLLMTEVNLKELAGALQVSLPTMQKLLETYPELPVVERGGLGKQWRINLEAAIQFFEDRRAEEAAAATAKNEALAQLTLPLKRTDTNGAEISLDDQLKAVKLRKALQDEQVEAGFLVRTADVRSALEKVFRRHGQVMIAMVARICATHNLPDPVRRAIELEINRARETLVKETLAAASEEENNEPSSLFG